MAHGEVVGPVQHQVVLAHTIGHGREGLGHGLDLDMRIERAQTLDSHIDLRPADVGGGEQHLALQVRQADHIGIDQGQPPNTGRRQILRRRAADAAQTDDHHPRRLQPLLPRPAHLGQHQMPGVALDLVIGKGHGEGCSRREA